MAIFRISTLLLCSAIILAGPGSEAATIAWNDDTYLEISNSTIPADCGTQLYYPRMVKCPNGNLVLFAQSGNGINGGCILSCRSFDGGWSFGPWNVVKRWGQRQWFEQTFNAQYANANPLVVGNEVLLCYQVRAAQDYDDTRCGIEVIRSSDSCATWSAPAVAIRARIWEPRMVSLGGGVLRCYYTRYDDIDFVQSPNNGYGWQAWNTSKASVRMPSPVMLQNGELAVAGESGSPAQGPWGYGSHALKLVNTLFDGYGPQMLQTPHGETLLAANGVYRGNQGVWMFIGNTNADNFASAHRPFLDASGVWPDICLNGSTIVLCSAGNANGIRLIHGRISY